MMGEWEEEQTKQSTCENAIMKTFNSSANLTKVNTK